MLGPSDRLTVFPRGRIPGPVVRHVLTGSVIGSCMDKHRHEEFLKFLRTIDREAPETLAVHMILDNYATHKHPAVKAWMAGPGTGGTLVRLRNGARSAIMALCLACRSRTSQSTLTQCCVNERRQLINHCRSTCEPS